MPKSGFLAIEAWKAKAGLECGGGGAWLPEKPTLFANDNVGWWNGTTDARALWWALLSPLLYIRHDVAKH